MLQNPYQSPAALDESVIIKPLDLDAGVHLVATSLWLAIFCELLPLEADCVYFALQSRNVLGFLLLRGIFLAIVLGPLFRYFQLSGRAGLIRAWRQIACIAVLLGAKIAIEAWSLIFPYGW
jgi:hypothetical protein